MKKKGTALLSLALTLALSLTACTSGKPDSGMNQENSEAGQTETVENGGAGQTETVENGGAGQTEAVESGKAGQTETVENGEAGQTESAQTGGEDTEQDASLTDAENFTNDGLILSVPEEYRDLLVVETPQDDENGTLFNISEKASVEAEEFEGAGWLCGIARVSQNKLHEMLCYDMSGAEVMAKDGDGSYYIFLHPTDVRIARSGDLTDEDMQQWSMLNQWAATLMDQFPAVNGLTVERRDNSDLSIYLSRTAWMPGVQYTISTLDYGPLLPGDVDPMPFVARLTEGAAYEMDDSGETPDGEYVVLTFPEDNIRFDFFASDETCIRQVLGENGEYETLYRADFSNGETSATAVMQEWYDAIAAAQGLVG